MELIFQGQRLELMADRAVYWPAQQAILVADLHWGKDATFRAHGIPVSRGQLEDELQRLIDLCQRVSAKRLYVLGDLCHAPEGLDLDTRALIREACQPLPERFLIEGNHDRRLRQVVESWGFAWLDEPSEVAGLTLRHHPGDGLYGHIHPTFRVKGPGEAIRLPCFVYDDERLLLPAFTGFSGGPVQKPEASQQIVVIAGSRLFKAN